MSFPTVPTSLKQVSHFMKVALEHDQRDPVVAYWARFHTVQKALTIDKSSPEAKQFLIPLLDWLERRKKELNANEAVTNETVAQAHIENYSLKLFKYADDSDRKGIFNKNTIKAFYTSSMLIDVLENFGEITEEFDKMRKYGKWKAAYIHNCLKNGETPISGPIEGEGEDDEWEGQGQGGSGNDVNYGGGGGSGSLGFGFNEPGAGASSSIPPPSSNDYFNPNPQQPQNPPGELPSPINPYAFVPPPNDTTNPNPTPSSYAQPQPTATPSAVLSVEKITQAQKYCKFAGSALNFDDVSTAISNLKKALHLLETGQELPE